MFCQFLNNAKYNLPSFIATQFSMCTLNFLLVVLVVNWFHDLFLKKSFFACLFVFLLSMYNTKLYHIRY